MASGLFFWLTIGFFVFQSTWIALSALYPQAFDEQFHFGIIQVYSHHWLPFLKTQPPNADPYGAVTRDPSYFYHYAMSFPFRFIELFTHDQTTQVILLRLINVVLFTVGLILFRKVLKRAGLSELAINLSILVTALIPVAPQLAGQINYDNMLILLTAWACLLTFNVIEQLRKQRIDITTLLGLLVVCLIASIVKYEFLPIFLGIGLFIILYAGKRLRGHWNKAVRKASKEWWVRRGAVKWLVVVGFVVAFALFAQRDIGNIITYHTVAPDCSQVLNIQQCSAYSVWVHDYESHQAVANYDAHVDPNPFGYLFEWVYWLWYRLFFAIDGPASGFRNYPPLPLPAASFAIILVVSVVAIALRGWRVLAGNPYLEVLALIALVYLLTLFGAGYQVYLQTGVLELMNGRYLFPILLPGAAVAIPAVAELTKGVQDRLRYAVVALLLVCFLEGGGLLTFIARSNQAWYWHNTAVLRVNDAARDVLDPLIFDGPDYYSSSRWFFN